MNSSFLLKARIVGPPARDSWKWLSTGDFVVASSRTVSLIAAAALLMMQKAQAKMTGIRSAVYQTVNIATMSEYWSSQKALLTLSICQPIPSSSVLMSFEKRLRMRPIGVTSK